MFLVCVAAIVLFDWVTGSIFFNKLYLCKGKERKGGHEESKRDKGGLYKSLILLLASGVAKSCKSCKLYASRLLHQPKSECCCNRRIPNEKPSDIRQIQSSPVAEY
jgi:hypothetical protein